MEEDEPRSLGSHPSPLAWSWAPGMGPCSAQFSAASPALPLHGLMPYSSLSSFFISHDLPHQGAHHYYHTACVLCILSQALEFEAYLFHRRLSDEQRNFSLVSGDCNRVHNSLLIFSVRFLIYTFLVWDFPHFTQRRGCYLQVPGATLYLLDCTLSWATACGAHPPSVC